MATVHTGNLHLAVFCPLSLERTQTAPHRARPGVAKSLQGTRARKTRQSDVALSATRSNCLFAWHFGSGSRHPIAVHHRLVSSACLAALTCAGASDCQ